MRDVRVRPYRRGRYWWVSVSVDGERTRRSTGLTDSRAARMYARNLERELVEGQEAGQDTPGGPVTLAQACRAFETYMAKHYKPGAYRNYPSRLRALEKHFPGRALATITEREAFGFLEMREPRQRPNDLRMLGRFFKWCAAAPQRFIGQSPLQHAEKVKAVSKPRRALTSAEVKRLLEAVAGSDLETPVALALSAGLRAGEVCALRWLDIDLEAGQLSVTARDAWSPKNSQSETVPVSPDLVRTLAQERVRSGSGEYVCTRRGKPWRSYELSRQAAKVIRGLDIDCTLHCLRHTFVTALVADPENDPKTVQRLARHKDIGTTFNVYAHAQQPRLRQAVARLHLTGVARVVGS